MVAPTHDEERCDCDVCTGREQLEDLIEKIEARAIEVSGVVSGRSGTLDMIARVMLEMATRWAIHGIKTESGYGGPIHLDVGLARCVSKLVAVAANQTEPMVEAIGPEEYKAQVKGIYGAILPQENDNAE